MSSYIIFSDILLLYVLDNQLQVCILINIELCIHISFYSILIEQKSFCSLTLAKIYEILNWFYSVQYTWYNYIAPTNNECCILYIRLLRAPDFSQLW